MSDLRHTRFDEFIVLQRGFDLPRKEMTGGPYPVVGSTSIIGYHNRYKVNPPGVVTGRSGSLGFVQYICDKYWPHNTSLWVKDFKGNFPRYVYYHLLTLDLKRFNSGVGVPTLNRNDLDTLEIAIPLLSTQHKIAAILSAYDDLIENNLQRIKILEEMAQLIYREWFVNFRFPGHEKVKMVDSELGMIPEGWEVKEMRELADVIDCLHSKKPEAIEKGYGLLLQLFNIGDGGKIDLSKKYLISESDYKLWTSRIEVQSGDCVITNVGRIAAVAQIPEGVKAALGRNMTSVRAKPMKMTPTFLIEYLLSPHMENEVLKKRDSGTIMDSLNVKGIVRLLVPVPPLKLMTSFEVSARPIRRRIEVLVGQNFNLRQTHDLLLPKLVSGDVDVSDLDIKTGDDK